LSASCTESFVLYALLFGFSPDVNAYAEQAWLPSQSVQGSGHDVGSERLQPPAQQQLLPPSQSALLDGFEQ
jgi:hypothetical protein